MSPVRWDDLPPALRTKQARKTPHRNAKCSYRCVGVRGCGELLDQGWAHAIRHSEAHHGCRLELVR